MKLLDFFIVTRDIISQNEDTFAVKIIFLYSIITHYFLKIFGIKYSPFPEMRIKADNCYFKTRKNTIDFWMVWKNYERDIFNEVNSLPKRYSIFIDVGANIGRYSVIMAKKGLQVYSFEPLSSNFEQLKINASLNNVENNIQFYNLALGDKESEQDIFFQEYKHGEASFIAKDNLQREREGR